jgi:hypothetical protein
MDGFHDGASVPASVTDARRSQRWSRAVGEAVLRRVEAGESLPAIGLDPTMPAARTMRGWIEKRPAFRAAMEVARSVAGRSFAGRTSTYCRETCEVIYERLCAGEAMVAICNDPTMPVQSTAYKWMKERDDFRRAVGLAREIQGDRLGAKGWEMAQAATPQTARMTEMQLRHLRWYAGKLSPRVYGPAKAVESWAAAGETGPPPPPPVVQPEPKITGVTRKSFWTEVGPDGRVRVRASWYCPTAGRIEEDIPGDWKLSPGEMHWKAEFTRKQQAEREAKVAAQALRRQAGIDPDPGGWL